MPKMKTHKTSAKRLKVTKKGKILRRVCGKSHLLTGKSAKKRRALRKSVNITGAFRKEFLTALVKG